MKKYLLLQGYRVSTAENGMALRRLVETGAPDLIVLDIMMPGEDGLTLCRELSARSGLPFRSSFPDAKADETDRVIGLELGADDYLVNLSPLVNCLLDQGRCCAGSTAFRRNAHSPRRINRFDRWI